MPRQFYVSSITAGTGLASKSLFIFDPKGNKEKISKKLADRAGIHMEFEGQITFDETFYTENDTYLVDGKPVKYHSSGKNISNIQVHGAKASAKLLDMLYVVAE